MSTYEINLSNKSLRLIHKLREQYFANYGELLSLEDAVNIIISGDKNE